MKHRMLGGITGIALSVTTLISMSACFPQDSSDRLTPITLNEVPTLYSTLHSMLQSRTDTLRKKESALRSSPVLVLIK